MMYVAQLNSLRAEGNQFFSKRKYSKAVEVYSRCISECVKTLESSGGDCEEDEIRHNLLLAWSNKAEANLKLKRFQDALTNAEKALELNANDGKSLNRRARAFEGLQRFREANLAYLASLKQSPEDQDTREALIRTRICCLQSEKGEYDLSKFYLGGCKGQLQPCCEYIGPVEIQKASSGGRGLFATREIVAGELLFVSKALALAPAAEEYRIGPQLVELAGSSPRHMHQLKSLAHTNYQEGLEIPSMDLFIPGSAWKPSKNVAEELDWDMSGLMYFNTLELHGHTADASEFYGPNPPRRIGVWGLPSFLNHSCSPNTLRVHIGDAMFVRATQTISSGEELTMTYVDTSDVIQNRQKTCQTLGFQCSCPCCKFEQEYEPLQKMSKIFYDTVTAHTAGTFPIGYKPIEDAASHYEGVAKIISSAPHLTLHQKNWIRASCIYAYIGQSRMVEDVLEHKIPVVSLMVEAEMLVASGRISALHRACGLLRDVRKHYGKRSAKYLKMEKHVLGIFRVTYGTDNQKALLYLIEKLQKLKVMN